MHICKVSISSSHQIKLELYFTVCKFSLLDADTHQKLCILNENLNRGIQDLFYNKGSDSVITSSYSTSDLSIQCRTTSIEHIRRGKPDLGFPVLESEKLHWPAYIQLDNVNEKIICSSIEDR